MDAEAIVSISAAVVALTQLVKWGFLEDRYGPLAVLMLSVLGVGTWGVDQWQRFHIQPGIFEYFTGWISVATSAAGIFGFTRASSTSLTQMRSGNDGAAGNSATNTKESPL